MSGPPPDSDPSGWYGDPSAPGLQRFWSGSAWTLWVTIACVGLLAIVGATLLEKGRAVLRAGLDSVAALTEGWE